MYEIDSSFIEKITMIWQCLVQALKNMFVKITEFISHLFKVTNSQRYKKEFHYKNNYLIYRPKVNTKYKNIFKPRVQYYIHNNC